MIPLNMFSYESWSLTLKWAEVALEFWENGCSTAFFFVAFQNHLKICGEITKVSVTFVEKFTTRFDSKWEIFWDIGKIFQFWKPHWTSPWPLILVAFIGSLFGRFLVAFLTHLQRNFVVFKKFRKLFLTFFLIYNGYRLGTL